MYEVGFVLIFFLLEMVDLGFWVNFFFFISLRNSLFSFSVEVKDV